MTVTVGPVRVSGYDLTDRDVFPPDGPDPPPCPRCGEPMDDPAYTTWCERCVDAFCGWERA